MAPIAALRVFRDSRVPDFPLFGGARPQDNDSGGVRMEIKGLPIRQRDQAIDAFERIANSVFFRSI
jgi:hypothetical protein